MALDQNAKYPVGTSPATADYPEGSAVNSTAPGALDGYPLEKDQLNDRFGLEQALLRLSGQAASGLPDTAQLSQYLKGIVELAAGRAINYDVSGPVNAYVLDLQANQQGPAGLFDGLRVRFTPNIVNTGPSTINPAGLGAKNLKTFFGKALPAGYLTLTPFEAVYNLAADEYRLDPPVGGELIHLAHRVVSAVQSGTFTSGAWQTRPLNVEEIDTGGHCTLAANQFTLDAGTYQIYARAQAYQVNQHNTRLYNITDAAVELYGTSEVSGTAVTVQQDSVIVGQFTIAAQKTFEFQHYCASTNATNGFGSSGATASGTDEVYATVILRKVK